MATQLAAEIDADKKMTATNILVKLLRLAQICGGYASWDARIDPETGDLLGESAIEHLPTNPLIDEFVEYVRETDDDEKVIAWACFIPFVDKLTERLTAEGIPHVVYTGRTSETDREEYVRRFNQTHARECKVFIGNPAAGGTGINVRGYDPDQVARGEDHGCDVTHVAYLLQNWSHAHRSQSEDRAHRRGTRRNVQYTVFLCRGTILEEINTRLTSKKMNAYTIQDVRDILRAVLDVMPEEDDE
jgi:SNF2 family DNA or RNA helicase